MNRGRIPKKLGEKKICIICEGNEEYEYLECLSHLKVWNGKYQIVLQNAKGNGNIAAIYQDKYQNDSYDLVLVFCDTDKKPYEQYSDIKRKINNLHGRIRASDMVVIYGNPCTMQIVLLHWLDIILKSPAKKVNASYIQKCTGVENYKGRADQREIIFSKITVDNYIQMCKRSRNMPRDDNIVGSSNFGSYMDYFMRTDDSWIYEINTDLEE